MRIKDNDFMGKKVAVIGSGVGGMATAIRLASRGYKVDVYEKNDYPGGKLTYFTQDGFRFDAGPSLFTLPSQVVELLNITNKNTIDYFAYTRLPITCKYFYEDGTVINGYANPRKFCAEVGQKTGENPQRVWEHLQQSKKIYDITHHVFLERSLHKIKTYLMPSTIKSMARIGSINAFTSMAAANQNAFESPKVTQLFNRFATYNGSDPYQAPATLNIIPHLEHNIGAYFPIGGMHSITQTLYRLALEEGVCFEFNSMVEEIVIEKNTAEAIIVNGKRLDYDLIVSNMDIVHSYGKLLHTQKAPKKIVNQPKSSSALIFYWGIKKNFPELDLHNIFFSNNYEEEFKHIFRKYELYHDPTVYINISSKYNPSDAPEGCENWFTMINVPSNKGQDWTQYIADARAYIIAKMSRMLNTDITPLIVTEDVLDPVSIENKTSSHQGSLYGSNSNNRFAAFLRHANFSSKIKQLYFCGGSVHPGGGIPLCLLSAKIVDSLID